MSKKILSLMGLPALPLGRRTERVYLSQILTLLLWEQDVERVKRICNPMHDLTRASALHAEADGDTLSLTYFSAPVWAAGGRRFKSCRSLRNGGVDPRIVIPVVTPNGDVIHTGGHCDSKKSC